MRNPLVFPAYAGMIPGVANTMRYLFGVPRIRGDDPYLTANMAKDLMCSPHTRG